MNRKSRKRLTIATIVLVVAFAGAVVWIIKSQGVYYRQVGDLSSSYDGKVIKVGGRVFDVSHDDSGYRFSLSDLTGKAATVRVAYNGRVPDTFGPNVDVVVVGRYNDSGRSLVADELQTKCPSKYKPSPTVGKLSPGATQ